MHSPERGQRAREGASKKNGKRGIAGRPGSGRAWGSVCHNTDVKKEGRPMTKSSANPSYPRGTARARE